MRQDEIDLAALHRAERQQIEIDLVLPHSGIPERDFVLYPLRDVAPDLHLPGMGVVSRLAARVPDRGLQRLA